ncbi:hypothetical protein MO867_18395 [Microbulbifer sp. OS29]|uniref:Uncharacterized protein n=1 Tax=Microbulbifer okhotskensis TaxID=2926617 RepID=A0A9X2EUV7_9GAMM|nr:hypothetical protein [Microbulbifer okhotskensis]MCO1336306.1 hypothetical protein [Microbulbifer okhotskensis]
MDILEELKRLTADDERESILSSINNFKDWVSEVGPLLVDDPECKTRFELLTKKAEDHPWIFLNFPNSPMRDAFRIAVRFTREMEVKSIKGNALEGVKSGNSAYVSQERLKQLESLKSDFDYSRLIAFLKEINLAFESEMFFSVGCLLRSVLDHVPPVFECPNFKGVYSNYSGGRSFKYSMKNLDDQIRNIADSYLHTHIRKKESLPEPQQVDVRTLLDKLLEEVIRIEGARHSQDATQGPLRLPERF